MTEEAARNELAAVRLFLRVPDGESVMGFLRKSEPSVIDCDGQPLNLLDTLRRVIRNARPGVGLPKWSAVARVTDHGCGFSTHLCKWAGVLPDAPRKSKRGIR